MVGLQDGEGTRGVIRSDRMIPNYHSKLDYLYHRQRRCCAIALADQGGERNFAALECLPTDLHHRLKNTKPNRRRFPLFVHSLLNLVAVCRKHHMEQPHFARVSLREAEHREATLKRWPKARAFVLGEEVPLRWKT